MSLPERTRRFTGIGDAAAGKRLNARMAEWEKEALARTKAAAVTMRTDDRSEQWKAEGVFSYEVKRNGGGIASLLFSDYLLHAGGANGLDTKTGLTFFTVSGETLTLPELFSNSENGMLRVNREVNRLLEERGLMSQLLVSNPRVEAGQPFYLTDTCLVIVVLELNLVPAFDGYGGTGNPAGAASGLPAGRASALIGKTRRRTIRSAACLPVNPGWKRSPPSGGLLPVRFFCGSGKDGRSEPVADELLLR